MKYKLSDGIIKICHNEHRKTIKNYEQGIKKEYTKKNPISLFLSVEYDHIFFSCIPRKKKLIKIKSHIT